MHVNWSALGLVFVVSLVVTIVVTLLFAAGIVAKGRGRLAVAIASFSACGVVTLFGIAVILA
jgi:hypothetical protein